MAPTRPAASRERSRRTLPTAFDAMLIECLRRSQMPTTGTLCLGLGAGHLRPVTRGLWRWMNDDDGRV